jgi:very-short-patch-repair endonuclease
MYAWRYDELRILGASRGQIRAAVARGALDRLHRDLYVRPSDLLVDRLHAVRRLLPVHASFGFHTAAELHGFGVLQPDSVHVVVPQGMPFPDIKGVTTHRSVVPFDPVDLFGLPCVPAARCAVDLARAVRRPDAIAVLDAALRSTASSTDELDRELLRHDRLRGVRQARQLVPLADGRAECRQESQLRLLLLDARLPTPEPQLWIPDDWGDPRYRLDLGWQEHRVGAEYDGASHLDRDRLRHDRSRHNWLETRGWRMRYFTDRDLYRNPRYIVATMRAVLLGTRLRDSSI